MTNPKVSVVIPVYNSEKFIRETVDSVLKQDFPSIEVIIINDGSTDNTLEILKSAGSDIKVYTQVNAGVSAARNYGQEKATGEYICFLDSDDILSPDFISSRVTLLNNAPGLDFCCGDVETIDVNGHHLGKHYKGISTDFFDKILNYDNDSVTCPSNYLFRSFFLKKNGISFNTALSSSADRHFLISLSFYGKGGYVNNQGRLYYRIHTNSMSHYLSEKLLQDNYRYMRVILSDPRIPSIYKAGVKFKVNYILSGGYYHLGHYTKSFQYALSSFISSPKAFITSIISKH